MIASGTDHQYAERIVSFESISVGSIKVEKKRISGDIEVRFPNGGREIFRLIFSYTDSIKADLNLAGLILTMPVINFSYFSRELILNFPVSEVDSTLITKFMETNSVEVFVNKICRRRYEFFRSEYLPLDEEITEENAKGITKLTAPCSHTELPSDVNLGPGSLVLSSGGKESLLTFGLMQEIGNETKALFFNESGGHWKTAKTSFNAFLKSGKDVSRVWSNVDRFYKFMSRRVSMVDQAAASKRADTYPLRLFIFPVYIFAAIPLVNKYGIGNILMGNEFDDPREMPPFHGIKHYYGIYDQSRDFMTEMTRYLQAKRVPAQVWSAVYPVSGIVVENVLSERYHDLFIQQRSCHSCNSSHGVIRPCGKCTKCLGVMMFVEASGMDPTEIQYDSASVAELKENVLRAKVRIDPDELAFLKNRLWGFPRIESSVHVTGIHLLPYENESFEAVPEFFRKDLRNIFSHYCTSVYSLEGERWIQRPDQK